MVNFQIAEGGPSHQIEMPDVKGPDELPPRSALVAAVLGQDSRPLEMRPVFGLESMIGGANAGASYPSLVQSERGAPRRPGVSSPGVGIRIG